MTMKLGLRPPVDKPAIRFGAVLRQVPDHPPAVNHTSAVKRWHLLGNDRWGDCGPVGVANSRALTTKTLTGKQQYPTLNQTLDLYRRSGNAGFPAEDNGVVLQDMLSQVVTGGIAGHKALAFAKVDVHDLEQVKAAIAIFGFVLIGANLQEAQATQKVWDLADSPGWGSHCVLAADYKTGGFPDIGVVTWGRVVGVADRFWPRVREAFVVIWPEHVGTRQFQEGIDAAALAADYRALTGRILPIRG